MSRRGTRRSPLSAASLLLLLCLPAAAQEVAALPQVEIIGVGPLRGAAVLRDRVPANVQTATANDLERSHALDLSALLNRSFGSVTLSELQGNPFQPDLNYRGYTSSPLLGTPQGLSVFVDGVRINQSFGDVVSWDLIPRSAIASISLMPGSNPVFGLNTLGGALAVQTKDGLKHPGSNVQVLAGSFGRAAVEFESGGSRRDGDSGLHWFATGQRFHERGWRPAAPSDVQQLFAKLGHQQDDRELTFAAALADNTLGGSGLQEQAALQRDWRSAYTLPDQTHNRALWLNLTGVQKLRGGWTLSGQVYHRQIATRTSNGDANDRAFDQALYQPDAAERAALDGAGYSGFPASGADASNTPFPRWRCIASVLLNSAPNAFCNGLINRTRTAQRNYGLAVQMALEARAAGFAHQLIVGAAYDASRVHFTQGTQFGFIAADRAIAPVSGPGAFADGTQASDDAFDARVELSSRSQTTSLYVSDTIALAAHTHLTLAGRHNRNAVRSSDGLKPGGGAGSLDGSQVFSRFNPALGFTHASSPAVTVYGGVSQGSRAPSAVELGCADPATPCRLPNAFAGDPPLRQVVTTTVEAGLRGTTASEWSWNIGVFRADNRDDLLFVADNASGLGYFRNFGKTRRQGLELALRSGAKSGWAVGGNLTLLAATYRSAETVGAAGNSSNSAAAAGLPGTDGTIQLRPGDRIALLPRGSLKLFAETGLTSQWRANVDLTASTGAVARGNENGAHRPDNIHYTGPGHSAGYAVVNMNLDWRPTAALRMFLQVNNLLDRKFTSAAQLGADGFDAQGNFIARPLPQNTNGDHPLRHGTFMAPGAPRAAWVGARFSFY